MSNTTLLERLTKTLRQTEFGDSEFFDIIGGVGVEVVVVREAKAFESFFTENGVRGSDGRRNERRRGRGVDKTSPTKRNGSEERLIERES